MASKLVLCDLDFAGNIIKRVCIESGSELPKTEKNVGRIFLTGTTVYYFDGSTWQGLANATQIEALNTRVTNLETTVGSSTSGLVKDLDDLKTKVNGMLPLAGGTMVGNIDMNGYLLKNVASPEDSDDAANKAYVDDEAAKKADKAHKHVSTDITDLITMINGIIGNIVGGAPDALDTLYEIAEALKNDPEIINTILGQIADVKATADAALPLKGGKMAGNIDMREYHITNLAHPVNDHDAASRLWVNMQLRDEVVAGEPTFTDLKKVGDFLRLLLNSGATLDREEVYAPASAGQYTIYQGPDTAIYSLVAVYNEEIVEVAVTYHDEILQVQWNPYGLSGNLTIRYQLIHM